MRPLLVAALLAASSPALAGAPEHVKAAKIAERHGDWKRALAQWKAAYASDLNAEYLVHIGDAYARLGDVAQAKKSYAAYLADPLAMPANVASVKARLAKLDAPAADPLALPGLDLPPPPAAKIAKAEPPSLPTAKSAKAEPPPLPALELPLPSKNDKKVASAAPTLDLPALPGTTSAKPAATAQPAVSKPVQVAVSEPKPDVTKAPPLAVTTMPQTRAEGGKSKTVAYVAAGIAVASLGAGVFAYTKANSAHSDLTTGLHDRATAGSLLSDESRNRTLSFVGFATGLVATGVAAALFAF